MVNKFLLRQLHVIKVVLLAVLRYFRDAYHKHKWLYWLICPGLVYVTIFYVFQPHYIGNFSHGFFLDNGDGLQNIWNIWWVNKAVTQLHANPYYTTMLHWPHGVSLVAQTLNIYNGLIGIVLMKGLGFSLVEAVNFAVVSAFVFGGITMFWLLHKLFSKYSAALIGGGLFTFSSYHFAHAQGHLQLVSLQFIPLFILSFIYLTEKLTIRYALAAAGALLLVILCDYYYFVWSVLVAGAWLIWQVVNKKLALTKKTFVGLGVFGVAVACTSGLLMYRLIHLNNIDPLTGSHDSSFFSLDPFMLAVPGGSWYWHSATDFITKHWPYFAESSVYLGFGVIFVLLGRVIRFIRKGLNGIESDTYFWWLIMIGFLIMALGPHLTILKHSLKSVPLPYGIAEKFISSFRISGMPIRWTLIAILAAVVIVTQWLSSLDFKSRRGYILLSLFILVSMIDFWPRQLPLTTTPYRPYVYKLASLPYGAVIDNGALSEPEQLYNQTLHQKPQAFGYVSRLPRSTADKSFYIFAALEQGRYASLCRDYKIRYLTLPVSRPLHSQDFPVIYNDHSVMIYDLKNGPGC